jgi:hypothetical protein
MSSVSTTWRILGARALSALGRKRAALARLDAVLLAAPAHPRALFHKGALAMRVGEPGAAERALRELVAREPNFPRGLSTLARVSFPGPAYRDVLASLHQQLAPRTYLEIGVEFGLTLRLAERSQQAVGVDPNPRPRKKPRSNTQIFAETSDDFFARHSRQELFGEEYVDFAFIDGMHRFEYVLRDFCNAERWCKPSSTIVLHDCLPVAPVSALRERQTQFWVGDTWKALECLLSRRPDLKISVIPCYPSGLVLIQNLDPLSNVLHTELPALEKQYMDQPYPYSSGSWPAHYSMIENSAQGLSRALLRNEHASG